MKIVKPLASLWIAVIVILSLALCTAIGTIIEAKFDAETASYYVYHSVWMYTIMGVLTLNLIAVMIDRWPWQERHVGFVMAHIGIIVLLLGALITQQTGVDGSLRIELGATERFVTISNREVALYSKKKTESEWARWQTEPIDLFEKNKSPFLSWELPTGESFVVDKVMPYATASERIREANAADGGGPGLRLQIYNERINQNFWLLQKNHETPEHMPMGPAFFHLGAGETAASGKNEAFFDVNKDGSVKYTIIYKDTARTNKVGLAHEGDEIETGWMNLKFRVLRILPLAKRTWEIASADRPTATTTSAIHVVYSSKNLPPAEGWIQLDDVLKFFSNETEYVVKFGHKMIDIGFDMHLKDFTIGRYQGTMQAMTYESQVNLEDSKTYPISMNEPLKRAGYTFYQASFQEDPATGKPIATILSVNKDPGRWLKYLGSLIMIAGVIHLFWFRRSGFFLKKGK